MRTGRGPSDTLLVGVAEIATRLHLSSERVRQLAKADELPPPVGQFGRRQLVWQWADVEDWARRTGRITNPAQAPRSPDKTRAASELGAPRRLVVDQLMTWGPSHRGPCHVRVWAPPLGGDNAPVVLLGDLEGTHSAGVTNQVEIVAMTAAVRFLDEQWRNAHFFEYSMGLDHATGEFHRVQFKVRTAQRRPAGRTRSPLARRLGAELVDPSWTQVPVTDVERLTGDAVQIWRTGTYTADLLAATPMRAARTYQVTWDPGRAAALADLVHRLYDAPAILPGLSQPMPAEHRLRSRAAVADASLTALREAEQDVLTQPAGAAITLAAPHVPHMTEVFAVTQEATDVSPDQIWGALTWLRDQVANTHQEPDSALADYRQSLVPAVLGGWATLAWYDAGTAETTESRGTRYAPLALPDDLTDTGASAPGADTPPLLLLLNTLTELLDERWDPYFEHEQPRLLPSTALPTNGPLTTLYLRGVQWQPLDQLDQARLRRLVGSLERPTRGGLDEDGRLVIVNWFKEFVCEWPNGPMEDSDGLADASIRADSPAATGPTPVYIQYSDGRLVPLPSAADESSGNSYTWGYAGGGPANLAAATTQLLRVLHPDAAHDNLRREVMSRVASRHVPDWPLATFLLAATGRAHTPKPPGRRR